MIQKLTFGILALTICLAGCRNDRGASGSPSAAPLAGNVFKRNWSADLKLQGDRIAELHLRNDTLFVYTQNNSVQAMDRQTGELRYIVRPADKGVNVYPPTVLTDRVVIPTAQALEVFNFHGRRLKEVDLQIPFRSAAAGAGNEIYIGVDYPDVGGGRRGGTGRLLSIDLDNAYRATRWELMTEAGISAAPVIHRNAIFAGGEDGSVYAVTRSREPVWNTETGSTFKTGGPIRADLAVDDSGLYVASTDTKLYCLDRGSGKVKWQYFSGRSLETSPVLTADMVYQYVPGTGLVAIDKTQGKYNREPRWIVASARQLLSQDDKHAYVLLAEGEGGRIAAVDKQSGQILFRSKRTDFVALATNTKDVTVYAATPTGQVLAIDPVLRPGGAGELVMSVRPMYAVVHSY